MQKNVLYRLIVFRVYYFLFIYLLECIIKWFDYLGDIKNAHTNK